MLLRTFRKRSVLPTIVLGGLTLSTVSAQVLAKPQVANLITKVENGVDEFRKYLERRGENARDTAATPQEQTRRGNRAQAQNLRRPRPQQRRTIWMTPWAI